MPTKLNSVNLTFSIVAQLLLLVQFASVQAISSSPPPLAALSARIDEYMNAALRAEHFSGSILLARGGRLIASKGYGMANIELEAPNTPSTVFRIASLTKGFTAAAVMQLHEKGRLSVDDPFYKHLDNCPPAWQPVMVKHLLMHTSGILNYTNLPGYEKTAGQFATDEEIVARFRDKSFEFTPGEQYKYNNSGYHLLGMIIEKISGKSYGDYLRENIFAPLGMNNAGRDLNKKIIKYHASGYALEDGSFVNGDFQDMAHLHAEGGLCSTTEDMLIWDQALYTERILSRKSLDEMFTPFKGTYGYGGRTG